MMLLSVDHLVRAFHYQAREMHISACHIQPFRSSDTEEEMKSLEALTEITVSALADNPRRDFLGELYMSLDFGSSFHGQFFTPWNIAYMMAK